MCFYFMLNIKEDILKLAVKHLMAPVDFYSIYFHTIDVNGAQQLFSSSKFFESIFCCVQHNKETYRSLERHEVE